MANFLNENNIKDEDFYHTFSRLYTTLTLNNKAPWLKEGLPERGIAYNPKSGVVFKGVNSLLLEMKAAQKGFKDSRWVSQGEMDTLGWKPKEGEAPTPIAYINKYAPPVDVNPVTGMQFSSRNPRQKYYYVYNIEQIRNCVLSRDKDFVMSKYVTVDKIKNTVKNLGTKDIRTINYKLIEGVVKKVPDRMQQLAAGIVQYRLAQEFSIPYRPMIPIENLQQYKHIKIKQEDLLRTAYQVETVKDRIISKDEVLVHEKYRTVQRTKGKEQKREVSQERD